MRWAASTGDIAMSKLTALMGFLVLAISSAWAQTPPATPGSPPAGDATASGSGIAGYWWIIITIIVVAAVVYFMRRHRSM
jgi:heme/copper-type cytochrome/quinol oxidase subunit 2